LTLIDSKVVENRGFAGGGISSHGRLELVRSKVRANTSPRAGGGIDIGGTADLVDSVMVGNTARHEGGGVYIHSAGVLTLIGSHITRNTAGDSGGGIFNFDDDPRWAGTVTLDAASSVTGNTPDDCVGTTAC
jgi:hypothetical protein